VVHVPELWFNCQRYSSFCSGRPLNGSAKGDFIKGTGPSYMSDTLH